MFKKILTGAVAALSIGGAVAATATPAAAQYRGGHGGYTANYNNYGGNYGGGYRGYDRGHHNNSGAVLGAGILGLVIGAALTSNHGYAERPTYYAPTQYAPAYDNDCHVTYRWDPYARQQVPVTVCD